MKINKKISAKIKTCCPSSFFIRKCLTKLSYRINTIGTENIPASGPAIIVANHVTTIDAMMIAASCNRPIYFLINNKLLENKKLKRLFNRIQIIPISSSQPKREIISSLRKAKNVLAAGHLVCIFPEEEITGNGNMRQFRKYLLRITKKNKTPIIPLYIGGAWGSTFSNFHEPSITTRKKQRPYLVTLIFGNKYPSGTSIEQIREIIQKLSVTYFNSLKVPNRNLSYYFIKTAKANWKEEAIGDTTGKRLNFGQTLIATIALSKKLAMITINKDKVGIILPASVGGSLANVALTICGRIPVNLNFTVSPKAINSAISQCKIKIVITSKKLTKNIPHIKKIKTKLVYIEDIISSITSADKLKATIQAIFKPAKTIIGTNAPAPDDLATIIFSSGSTGEQKGIMLTHHNIISNIESFLMIYHFKTSDKMCAALPFFHSFGYTTTLWCPLLKGFTVFYHPNPLDGETIARIAREEKLTILLATPTFLRTYIRKAKKEDFATLRLIITGAEKLRKNISDTFYNKFNIRPIEGYGTTELSPVAAANVPNVVDKNNQQVGIKIGSIGHPIPGVAMRITDIDNGNPLPLNQQGMLEVRGPNVMLGYLNNQKLSDSVMHEGWYTTGDIARIDDDGFVFIHDRISRFSKIGGEMVPHMLIEELLFEKLEIPENSIFVASAPDTKRGEQLVVIYTSESTTELDLKDVIHKSDLPNLWKPRKQNYIEIEKMPVTGSGKLDMRKLSQIAHDFIKNRPSITSRTIDKIRKSL